ncbi:MAG: TRAP transporter TatT component family protein [Candidatus Bipolaricaulis sp.]|nr:TRAP transporter TatT component family protein [Candidatus Bipolaricaulis sp.]
MVKKIGFLLGIVLLVAGSAAHADEALEAAIALIPDGGDVAIRYDDAGRVALQEAIAALEGAVGVTASFNAMSEDAYTALEIPVEKKSLVNKLSQAYYTLGDVFLHTADGARIAFEKGQLWGLKSLRMNPAFAQIERSSKSFLDAVKQETDVAALYWTYGNWARKDEFDILGAVFRNDPPKLLALIERALELQPSYINYGAYRSLAAYYGSLPPMFGQDLPRALSYICPVLIDEPQYCAACATCPVDPDANEYLENRLIFAQYYLMKKGHWQEAARVLRGILAEPVGDLHPLYNAFDQVLAQELLTEVEKHL